MRTLGITMVVSPYGYTCVTPVVMLQIFLKDIPPKVRKITTRVYEPLNAERQAPRPNPPPPTSGLQRPALCCLF